MSSERTGYGIIRLSFSLAEDILPEAKLEETTVQRELRDTGFFAELKQRLLLPESYELLSNHVEPYQLCWVLIARSPEIPRVDEGALLPHCTPIYTKTFNGIEPPTMSLNHIHIESHDRVLRVD